MNAQLDMFNRPAPYQRGSETSRAAAASIEPATGTKRAAVQAFILGRGDTGATNEEVAEGLGFLLQTVCARCRELQGSGAVRDSGKRRVTRSGRDAVVWVAA